MAQRVIPKIFKEEQGAHGEKGEFARLSAFIGGISVADLVKTTLGPKGMDKILQSMSGKRSTITNDGATILKAMPAHNPSAKIIVDTSITQDAEVGDGTTTVAVLAGELLREAEKLILAQIHPQIVLKGWRGALEVAREALKESAKYRKLEEGKSEEKAGKYSRKAQNLLEECDCASKPADAVTKCDGKEAPGASASVPFEKLLNIARTTLSSKILATEDDYFAKMAVQAVMRLKDNPDLNMIQVVKKLGGNLRDSYLDEGFILDKKFGVGSARRIKNAKIMIANTSMDNDKVKIYGAKVKVDSVAKVAEIEEAEKMKMKGKVEKIVAHNINCFINRQLVYNYPEQMLAEKGVSVIEHADFEGVERLALVLGADIISTFDTPDQVKLGDCDLIEEVVIGEDRCIRFSGVPKGEACSIILRGSSQHTLDEAERSLHDALCVIMQTVRNSGTVLGGGASEMLMADAVDQLAQDTQGKERYAIEAFARALRTIPTILADNAGFDSSDLVAKLRALHAKGKGSMGINMKTGGVDCMKGCNVTESYHSKMQSLVSAHEAAEVIVRVDQIIQTAPRQRNEPDHGH